MDRYNEITHTYMYITGETHMYMLIKDNKTQNKRGTHREGV